MSAFREPDNKRFCLALESVLKGKGGRISWDGEARRPAVDCRIAHTATVQSIYLPYLGGFEHELLTSVGRELDVSWIVLFAQEGSIWEYALYRGDRCVNRFSVAPEYWDDSTEFVDQRRGDPRLLAETWGVPIESLRRYLVNWQIADADNDTFEFGLTGKAYPEDRFAYGDFNQVFDFLRALGGEDPTSGLEATRQHAIYVPAGV